MSDPALVWLVVGLVSGIAMIAVLVALIRHVFVLGRALARFQEEVTPIASSIANESARAGSRSRGVSTRSLGRSLGRPLGRP